MTTDRENRYSIIYIALSIIIIILSIATLHYQTLYKEEQDKVARFAMALHFEDDQNYTEGKIVGLYFKRQGFATIWMKDRKYSEVMETCSHEYLHYKHDGHFQ